MAVKNKSKVVYNGKFVRVTEEKIGHKIYEKAFFPPSLVIFPFTADGRIIFIKERRVHETPAVRWKLVSGFYEPPYNLRANVNRELQEEIGKKAACIRLYQTLRATGSMNSVRRYVLASGLTDSKTPNPDGEDTILDIKPLSIQEILPRVLKGELFQSGTGFVLLKLCLEIINGKISFEKIMGKKAFA